MSGEEVDPPYPKELLSIAESRSGDWKSKKIRKKGGMEGPGKTIHV